MKILIIRFSALGDLVTLEPTFRAFRYFFPDAHIAFLTSSLGKGLYEDTLYFDEYIIHTSFFKTVSTLKPQSFDLVFNLQCNKPSHYLSFFINKKIIINKSFNLWQKLFKIKVHAKDAKEMLSLANIDLNELNQYFSFPDATLIQFQMNKLNKANNQIVVSTGSSPRWLSKKWGLTRYEKLIAKLIEHDFQIILIGTKLEESDAEYITKLNPTVINLVNKTSLSGLKSILSKADLFIGNDSGPTHISAAVKTDTLTIFGPTDIQHSPKFGSYKGIHLFVRPSENIKCHPCYKSKCPTEQECMESISVDEVFYKIMGHFKRN